MTPEEIMQALSEISENAQMLGNKLRQLSTKTSDIDIVTIISSLATDAYNFSIDIKDTIDDYQDILESRIEDAEEEI